MSNYVLNSDIFLGSSYCGNPYFSYKGVDITYDEMDKLVAKKRGLKTMPAPKPKPKERIKGLIDNVTVDGLPFEEVQRRMKEPVVNISESFYDDFVKENAKFSYKAGLQTQIIRVLKGKKPCKWCQSLAGVYDYSEVSDTGNDVFRRHENCHCQVVYVNHKYRYMENVHTKK